MRITLLTLFVLSAPLAGCPVYDGQQECAPETNEDGEPAEECDGNAVVDSCGNVLDACESDEVCYVAEFGFQESGQANASCGIPGQLDDRCPSEETDAPPCADGLTCTPTGENDLSTCQ